MTCGLCHRQVLVTWALGNGLGVCCGCIRAALRKADRVTFDRQSREALDRWRKMGFA